MSDVMLAPLSTLWSAMAPAARPAAAPPPDVGAIAAAAEAQGYARGLAEAEVALAPALAALAGAVAALEAALVIDPQALQPLFVDLVTRIASAVVDGELRQSREGVERLVTEALAGVEGGGPTSLHLSPADAAAIGAPEGVTLVIDPDLVPGEIRVETTAHVIAASLNARLAAIVGAL